MRSDGIVGLLVYANSWYDVWCLECSVSNDDYLRSHYLGGQGYRRACWPLSLEQLGIYSQECYQCGEVIHKGTSSEIMFPFLKFYDCIDGECDGNCDGNPEELDDNLYPEVIAQTEHIPPSRFLETGQER